MGIGIIRSIFGPEKTHCSKCHNEVNKEDDGGYHCGCRSWYVYY